MDAEALRKTREHYNSHSNLHDNREQVFLTSFHRYMWCARHHCASRLKMLSIIAQALEARRQGKALPLKDFHNDIKRKMINRWDCTARLQSTYWPCTHIARDVLYSCLPLQVCMAGRQASGSCLWPGRRHPQMGTCRGTIMYSQFLNLSQSTGATGLSQC